MNRRVLRGIELRYALTHNLDVHGRASIYEMLELLGCQGFAVVGNPSKAVSDALRWEVRRGRVRRLRRGVYGPGTMPRSTEYHIHQRVLALFDEVARLRGFDDADHYEDAFWDSLPA
ncbi:hypothetical protein [Mycolicibacterium holsaticum]|jgi:hypothetical protein|uniref:Uncharacterized protein n=1 Tax=Mycolicibacterium holsaticum TaxID=152142 RepID=A0A1E3RWY8_9MYCO|nr:hypothetical protein [Mycolicibacterium holsaticum]ODQ93877.1 hypothetical protein BHQ17_11535 [Mycolicibacterium holsaticum]